jgi:peptide/nickel transport system substrate-binding protein
MKRGLGFALVFVTVLSLVACGGSTKTAGGGKDSKGRDTTKATIAFSAEPISMSWWDNEEMAPIYSAYLTSSFLMKIDPETMKAVPDLAESVEAISDSEYVFHLRHGVYFHHGKEFKAEDVVATYNLIVKYPGSSPYVNSIVSVKAMDDYTVKFTMKGPYPNLMYDVAYKYWFILPADLIKSGHDFASKPVGTGPFKMTEWSKGDYIVYERFDKYWDKSNTPGIKKLVWKVIPEGASRTIALQTGEADIVYEVETADIKRIKADASLTLKEVKSVENYCLTFNNDIEPLNNINFRNAVAYGIDRKAIVLGALDGYAVPNGTSIALGYWGSCEDGAFTYDLEKAKKYLAAWGGDPSKVTLPILAWSEQLVRVATIIQSNMAALGIKVDVVQCDTATFSSLRAKGEYSAALSYWSPSNAFNYIVRYDSSKRSSVKGACNDKQVDELIARIKTTVNDDARLKLIYECVRRVNEIAQQPSLYQPITFRAYNKNLEGLKFTAHGYFDFSSIRWEN